MTVPYKRVHVIINPAAGGDEPILNTLNDVFRQYQVEWDATSFVSGIYICRLSTSAGFMQARKLVLLK